MTAEAVATELMVPLYVVRYEQVITDWVGVTTDRLHAVFRFASENRCVLLVDNIETIARDRAGSGFLNGLTTVTLDLVDRLPSHVVVVAATNREEMLDPAMRRRFNVWTLPSPEPVEARQFLQKTVARFGDDHIPFDAAKIADALFEEHSATETRVSYDMLERFVVETRRVQILSRSDFTLQNIATEKLGEQALTAVV